MYTCQYQNHFKKHTALSWLYAVPSVIITTKEGYHVHYTLLMGWYRLCQAISPVLHRPWKLCYNFCNHNTIQIIKISTTILITREVSFLCHFIQHLWIGCRTRCPIAKDLQHLCWVLFDAGSSVYYVVVTNTIIVTLKLILLLQ